MIVNATQLPGEGRSMIPKIATKAKAFGVFNSPTDGQMIYVDPNHDDEKHHSPKLTEAEAKVAFERGLIEDPADASKVDEEEEQESGEGTDPNSIENIGAAKSEEFSGEDTKGPGGDVVATRSTTAWPDADRVEGGAQGFTDNVRVAETPPAPTDIDTDSGDADAPPAPTRRRAAAPKTNTAPTS